MHATWNKSMVGLSKTGGTLNFRLNDLDNDDKPFNNFWRVPSCKYPKEPRLRAFPFSVSLGFSENMAFPCISYFPLVHHQLPYQNYHSWLSPAFSETHNLDVCAVIPSEAIKTAAWISLVVSRSVSQAVDQETAGLEIDKPLKLSKNHHQHRYVNINKNLMTSL